MTTRIFKYEFSILEFFGIDMPKESKILSVQFQKNTPCMWVEVDPLITMEKRLFKIYGTGHTIGDDLWEHVYIGTIQEDGGNLVWHLYEVVEIVDIVE